MTFDNLIRILLAFFSPEGILGVCPIFIIQTLVRLFLIVNFCLIFVVRDWK